MTANKELLVSTEKLTQCPLCNSTHVKKWCTGIDRWLRLSKQEFEYSTCQRCGILFQSIRPVESEVYHFYSANYAPYSSDQQKRSVTSKILFKKLRLSLAWRMNKRIDAKHPNTFDQDLKKWYTNNQKGALFLDFGCGSDAYLNKARTDGWKTIGMDFSDIALQLVRKSQHEAILYDSEDAWNAIQDNSVSFIRMNQVIEHLYKPKEVLKTLFSKLTTRGILHIATPNTGGLSARTFGTHWYGLECPRHIMIFNPEVLKNLLTEIGFTETEVLHESITKDYIRSIYYKKIDEGKASFEDIENCLHDQELASLYYHKLRSEAIQHRGDRIHIFARK